MSAPDSSKNSPVLARRRKHDAAQLRRAKPRARKALLLLLAALDREAPAAELSMVARGALRDVGMLWETAARVAE